MVLDALAGREFSIAEYFETQVPSNFQSSLRDLSSLEIFTQDYVLG